MSDWRDEELEIVGFNGRPLVECGRALPVVRRPSDRMHCILQSPLEDTPIAWYTEDEADAFAASGRWTKFASQIILGQTCFTESDGRFAGALMVVFADEGMLDTADRLPRPNAYHDQRFGWRRLAGYPETIQAACGSAEAIEQLLDDWAHGLLRRFDAMYHLGRDPEYLKRIADFALCAARSRTLRWKAYLRYASVQDPDQVRRSFESFTHREFPDATWEAFLYEVKSLCGVLRAVPAVGSQAAPPSSSPATALPKVRGIAAVRPIDLENMAS
jgi:hypothetical protein